MTRLWAKKGADPGGRSDLAVKGTDAAVLGAKTARIEEADELRGSARADATLLEIERLTVRFGEHGSRVPALRGIDLAVGRGQVVGLAGESGSGKSTAAMSIIGLLPEKTVVAGSVRLEGQELLGLSQKRLRAVRGSRVAMVFQETVTALNPVARIGDQLAGCIRAHERLSKRSAWARAGEWLERLGFADISRVLRSYPSELSGGMCQRVNIAMALCCGASLLLADEPTTALDVSIQRDILAILRKLVADESIGILLISHDLGVLSELTDSVVVLYKGEVVEQGPTAALLKRPMHPYTLALLECLPSLDGGSPILNEIPDESPSEPEAGCLFRGRCRYATEECCEHPDLVHLAEEKRAVRCWNFQDVLGDT